MSQAVDEHRRYLRDATRLDCFKRALAEVVFPGAIVADVGSGTGILGLLALQAGAARVISIESTPMLDVARALAEGNGFADRFEPCRSDLRDVRLQPRAHICVADFIGPFGFDAGAFEVYPHCAAQLLDPSGVLVPSELSLFVAPVERPDVAADVSFWTTSRHGVSLAPASDWALHTDYGCVLASGDLLADAGLVERVPLSRPPEGSIQGDLHFTILRRGTLHGLGAWFSARLSPTVEMTNSPLAADRISRRNVFFPLRSAVDVDEGDAVHVGMVVHPIEHVVSWTVDTSTRGGSRHPSQVHSTLRGLPLSREALRRTDPGARPVLNARGRAGLTVLQLCAEGHATGEIEECLWNRHHDLFPTRAAAAGFLAGLLARYGAIERGS